jgi:Type I restriction enzyme R protein N terminus (HSDR_N)
MKCHRPEFITVPAALNDSAQEEHPEFPDRLTDCLTGKEIPFSNRDNIRQKMLRFLLDEKGYRKEDIHVDREIRYGIEGAEMVSLVDISIRLGNTTMMVWKCASGSVVSRERQIIASARLLEDYLVPFAVVTNGRDLELLDTSTEKVRGEGLDAVPQREELAGIAEGLSPRPTNKKKISNEQRVLYTYDAIGCPSSCRVTP